MNALASRPELATTASASGVDIVDIAVEVDRDDYTTVMEDDLLAALRQTGLSRSCR